MKKVFSAMLCFMLVLGCFALVTACSGHNFASEWSKDETHHWHACTDCDEKGDFAEHSFNDDGECETCGYVVHDHIYTGDWLSDETNHWHKCDLCDNRKDEGAHVEETLEAVPATCTTTGLTEGKKCSECGKILVAQETVGMTAHSYTGDWLMSEEGHYKKCDNCTTTTEPVAHEMVNGACKECGYSDHEHIYTGDWLSDETNHWHKCDLCDNRKDESAHVEETLKAVPATCTTTGLTEGKKCSECGKILVAQETVGMTSHSYGAWTHIDGADGDKHERQCENCPAKETDNCVFGAWETVNEATCTVKGLKKQTCEQCHFEKTEDIDRLNHTYGSYIGTSEGHHKECSECNDVTATEPHNFKDDICSDCGYELKKVKVTEDQWKEALKLENLMKMRNFTAHSTMTQGGTSSAKNYEVTNNLIHEISDSVSEYGVHHNEYYYQKVTDYLIKTYAVLSEGLNIYQFYEGNIDDEIESEIQDYYEDYMFQGFEEGFSYFEFDDETGAYVYAMEGYGEVRISFSEDFKISTVHFEINQMPGSLENPGAMSMTLDIKVGETKLNFDPDHKHEFSKTYNSNNRYHWHDALCHDGAVDVKELHSYGDGDVCSVCGHKKAVSTNQVDEATFKKALKFQGIGNYTLEQTSGEETVITKITGNAAYNKFSTTKGTEEEFEESFIAWDEEHVWYYKIIDGKMTKLDVTNMSESYDLKNMAPTTSLYLIGWDKDADLIWQGVKFEDGVYTNTLAEFTCANPMEPLSFTDATITIKFADGEISEFTVSGTSGRTIITMKLTPDSAVIELPDAVEHEHTIKYVPYSGIHSIECKECDFSGSYAHKFVDGVCVCGAKDHTHTYVEKRYDHDNYRHYQLCDDCGARTKKGGWFGGGEDHDFDKDDICTVCGAERHYHNWSYGGEYDYNYHTMVCDSCDETLSMSHEFNRGSDTCSVCGAQRHEHSLVYDGEHDYTMHRVRCSVCDMNYWTDHVFENGSDTCSVCGAQRHEHTVSDWKQGDNYHNGYCKVCERWVEGEHEWNDEYVCKECGYKRHIHVMADDDQKGNDTDYHWGNCVDCEEWAYEEHLWDKEKKHCIVCGADYHEHNYQYKGEHTLGRHTLTCECGKSREEQHTYGPDKGKCTVCGADYHEHTFEVERIEEYNHLLRCAECGEMVYDEHDFNGGECTVCHAKNHDHIFDRWVSDDSYEHVRACECGVVSYDRQRHNFNDDGECTDCGFTHEHEIYNWNMVDENEHAGRCEICEREIRKPHSFDDYGWCEDCYYQRDEG